MTSREQLPVQQGAGEGQERIKQGETELRKLSSVLHFIRETSGRGQRYEGKSVGEFRSDLVRSRRDHLNALEKPMPENASSEQLSQRRYNEQQARLMTMVIDAIPPNIDLDAGLDELRKTLNEKYKDAYKKLEALD